MHVKRYEAATLVEAIRQVKQELGPEALVLSQRTLRRRSGFGLLGRSVVEVTAAVDRDVRRQHATGTRHESLHDSEPARVAPDPSWKELSLRRALNEPLEAELRELRETVETLARALPDNAALREDLADLRRATREVTPHVRATTHGAETSIAALLGAGIAPRYAHAIAARALELESEPGDPTRALADRLERRLVPERAPRPDAPILFVGAPGVGKTTTLAKWATREAKDEAVRVSLATLDAHRLGGDAALRAYAKRLEVACETVVDPSQLEQTRRSQKSTRLFVDAPGASAGDDRAIGELCRAREALGPHASVRLVVAATTKDDDLAGQLERFRPLEPAGLVVTKLDETRELGNVVNLLLDAQAPPLSWLGTGPHVPEDLVLPEPGALAGQILGALS
jgi:flagellar biosynthesis protein FlhF